jgi:hypothetical protein
MNTCTIRCTVILLLSDAATSKKVVRSGARCHSAQALFQEQSGATTTFQQTDFTRHATAYPGSAPLTPLPI